MTALYWNYCKWSATASGAGTFTVGAAAASDAAGAHDVPANCNVITGKTYKYFAQSGSQSETGYGVYNAGTLTRATILANSDNTSSPVNFATAPTVDMFISPPQTLELGSSNLFPSGTLMLFQQASAPTGWTTQTTHNDKVLRVVSSNPSYGGTNSFSTTFSYRTSDGSSLSVAQLAQHLHGPGADSNFLNTNVAVDGGPFEITANANDGSTGVTYAGTTGYQGSSTAHAHTYDMRVQYVDLIIARKN